MDKKQWKEWEINGLCRDLSDFQEAKTLCTEPIHIEQIDKKIQFIRSQLMEAFSTYNK